MPRYICTIRKNSDEKRLTSIVKVYVGERERNVLAQIQKEYGFSNKLVSNDRTQEGIKSIRILEETYEDFRNDNDDLY